MSNNIIDISHWKAPVDFAKVKAAGIVAVIAKATQGSSGIDKAYAGFKAAARAQGLLWGSYHFGTGDDVGIQVRHYLGVTHPQDDELICLDFEPNPDGSTMSLDQARAFVTQIRQRTGRLPLLYGSHAWLQSCLGDRPDPLLSQCPLWLAQYSNAAGSLPGWSSHTLWQFTDGTFGPPPHNLDGVGACDRNSYAGNDAELAETWPLTHAEVAMA